MTRAEFAHDFVEDLVVRASARLRLQERHAAGGGPLLSLTSAADATETAGFMRLWTAPDEAFTDRMVHIRLCAEAVDTQLFFLFGRPATVMPHFHAQVVQFGAQACVFNADLLPRLDPVDHPAYFRRVMDPLNEPYWKAVNDYQNVCSHAPGNPAIAVYLSPWSIGTSRPSTGAELDRVSPSIHAYLDHWLQLAENPGYPAPPDAALRERDARHLACFFDENLDRRAWRGVYGLIGEPAGRELRRLLLQPIT